MTIPSLVTKIILAKKAYYDGKPILSDYEYDRAEAELKKLDPLHPVCFLVGYSDEYDWWINHYETVQVLLDADTSPFFESHD